MEIQQRKAHIRSHLRAKGYSKAAIAAIMANIEVETGGTYDHRTKQINGPGYGLFQMEKDMKAMYDSYLKQKGLTDSAQAQIDFMHATLTEKKYQNYIGAGNAKKISEALRTGSVEHATQIFCTLFLRPGKPHLPRRIQSAKLHYQQDIQDTAKIQEPIAQGIRLRPSAQDPLKQAHNFRSSNFMHQTQHLPQRLRNQIFDSWSNPLIQAPISQNQSQKPSTQDHSEAVRNLISEYESNPQYLMHHFRSSSFEPLGLEESPSSLLKDPHFESPDTSGGFSHDSLNLKHVSQLTDNDHIDPSLQLASMYLAWKSKDDNDDEPGDGFGGAVGGGLEAALGECADNYGGSSEDAVGGNSEDAVGGGLETTLGEFADNYGGSSEDAVGGNSEGGVGGSSGVLQFQIM